MTRSLGLADRSRDALKSSGMLVRLLLVCLLSVVALPGQVRVVNDGFPGENTADLDARLDGALEEFRPDYVVLLAGGNDALNEKRFLPSQETGAHLEAMARRIKAHGAQVILVTVHDPDLTRLMTRHKPEAYGDRPPLQRLAQVNEQVQRVARVEHAPLVPFAKVLRKAGGTNAELSTDGVHLTAKGYELLAAAVRSKLPRHLVGKTTVLCFGDSLTYGIGVRPSGSAETEATYPSQLRKRLE